MRVRVGPGAELSRPSRDPGRSRPWRRARLLPPLLAALAAAAAASPAGAATSAEQPPPALSTTKCPASAKGRFVCGVLPVPLDHSGVVPGALGLRVMVQNPRTDAQRTQLLVALSGGPGQSGADDGAAVLAELGRPAGHRVVTLDQRGTGPMGDLVCPALSRVSAQAQRNGTCAAQLGDRRRFFTTRDTVADLELLRRTLGAGRMALMGTSYGTFVAQQYARTYPATTSGLILDSPVPAAGVDALGISGYVAAVRALRNQCGSGRCRGVTANTVSDLRRTLRRLSRGPLRGHAYTPTGRRVSFRYRGSGVVLGLLGMSDVNPLVRASLPAALHRAARGDGTLLARLVGTVNAARPETASTFSNGLNVTTSCLDARLPYGFQSPTGEREALTNAALGAVPPRAYAPFARADVLAASLADYCTGWPADVVAPPSSAPFPAVPTAILAGEDDVRTPLADARVLATQIPGARLHRFPGVGHSVLGSDRSGCARRVVRRVLAGRPVASGSCGATQNRTFVLRLPARRLSDLPRVRGLARDPGRIVEAVLATMFDAGYQDELRRISDAGTRGGGLRGGRYRSTRSAITLTRYALVPGVRVSGRFSFRGRGYVGRMRVSGPGRLDGALRISPQRIRGTVGGVRLNLVAGG